MLPLFVLILLGGATSLGFGAACLDRTYRRHGAIQAWNVGDAGLVGLLVLTCLGTLLNFAVAISPVVTALIASTGCALLIAKRGALGRAINIGLGTPATLVVLCLAVRYATLQSYASASLHYDTGLYHLQTILQIHDAPLVLGAANLHVRFGYNSLWFVLSAVLAIPGFGQANLFLANPIFFVFVILSIGQRVAHGWRRVGYARSAAFGTIALVAIIDSRFVDGTLGSPNTDVPSNIIVLYAAFLALFVSDSGGVREDREAFVGDATVLLPLIVAFAITIKLSILPVVLLLLVPLHGIVRGLLPRVSLGTIMSFTVPVLALWGLRGVATSGCFAYPGFASCIPVPWRINAAVAADDLAWMWSWSRTPNVAPDQVLQQWGWLPGWLAALEASPFFSLLLALAAFMAAGVACRLCFWRWRTIWATLKNPQRTDSVLILATAVAGLCFWFFSAPLPRYGMGWMVLPLLLAAAHVVPLPSGDVAFASCGAWAEARMSRLGPRIGAGTSRLARRVPIFLLSLIPLLFLLELPGTWAADDFPRIPQADVVTRTTRSGLRIQVPTRTDQCWAAPRPCTPFFSDRLTKVWFGPWRMITFAER